MKDHDKNKESSYLKYWDVNSLYQWKVSQKLPVNSFKWVEDLFEFDEDEGYSLFLEELHELDSGLPFLQERMKFKKVGKLVANLHDKN